ncbi:RNHCP domain-containing protein [Candidatus Peregrinibacteria bacterium CG_4_10_14_0_2_um_filter_38_24]|nr:MAG: RNHCP domain-containing protein [Candidatus Peregrinibacteria bacterium CG_4_10_14_0_2_um_filter_38_24]PJC38673.1 MAG: RNHCP domain-containing protein [Candidatus Peregrinibacteria bacterium CG_4_9_14_0_2_um_filter_38_9]
MKKFIVINEPFTCENCGEENPKANKTCRNHCRKCLYSKHVDVKYPGDRMSLCLGMMPPVFIELDKKKGWMITHKCSTCGESKRNKAVDDDNLDLLSSLIFEQNKKTYAASRGQKTGEKHL